jgi:short-subunit dehydrogenase
MLPSFLTNFFSSSSSSKTTLFAALGIAVALYAISQIRRRLRVNARRSSYKNKIAIITGASSGIGVDLASLASQRGCHVVLVARSKENLEKTADQIKTLGASGVTVCPCDVTKAEDVDNLVRVCQAIGKPLGFIALNAGRGGISNFDETDECEKIARELMEINYFANVNLTRKLLPKIKSDRADILVISSLSGILGVPQRSQYCASKFALQGFFNSLRMELRPSGINVTISCPGFVQTPFHAKVLATTAAGGHAPERKGHFMTSLECASLSLEALEAGDYELPMTLKGVVGYSLRPFIPSIVDMFVGKVAQGSLKK